MKFEAVIGLEVHVQLSTQSKIFCGCGTRFGARPNSQTCPVCLGLPGVLPVLNQQALMFALKVACALNCRISELIKFDRKNYFYPDLPKNFQISQYDRPLAQDGYLDIDYLVPDKPRESESGAVEVKKIGIKRVHLEEDAGKLLHPEEDTSKEDSLIDFNRTGIPLLEIVSQPEMDSPLYAYEYLSQLKAVLRYLEVSDCNMEEGSLRCDANVSVRPRGQKELGTRAEVKNMNSFKAVQKALEYELKRQIQACQQGEKIIQETRLWDADRQITISMRSKEEAHDYRYFPEPDLVPFILTNQQIEEVRADLPELPRPRRQRLIKEYSLPEYDSRVLTADRQIADFFESCCKYYNNYKAISNWVMGQLMAELKARSLTLSGAGLLPEYLTEMVRMIDSGKISGKIAKEVFGGMLETGKSPQEIVEQKGLGQISDGRLLREIIDKVIEENVKSVSDYRSGKENALKFLVGQVMAKTKGKANPLKVNELLRRGLKNEQDD